MSNMIACGLNRSNEIDYRGNEEMYVYDQDCQNCHNRFCPFSIFEDDGTISFQQLMKEDAIVKDDAIVWCIHWQQ